MGSDYYMNPPRPPKPDTQTIQIKDDGKTVRRWRYDDKVVLWQITGTTITVKVPGRKYWRGIGIEQGYAPAEFVVYQIFEDKGDFTYEVTVVAQFPAQQKKSK